jgi:hypothetical protein
VTGKPRVRDLGGLGRTLLALAAGLAVAAAMWLPALAASPTPGITADASATPADPTPAAATPSPRFDLASVPLLAYYYIWYDASSWNRAKSDTPLLGTYSSDDAAVMRQHVTWARAAGIDGFIVSWKNTTTLDKRLDALVAIAREQGFKLSIIYQGLDFSRAPLPATTVAEDLDYFISHYAADPVFDLFGKPLVIVSGTWEFTVPDIATITGPRRDRLLILGSERSVSGFARIADHVDGDAYYWSSVNPDSNDGYEEKLAAMSSAVHDAAGLWIAPASPGFDARLVGGTTVVDRQGGQMLQRQLDAALGSLPDAIGVISWNEFSENSQIEPSRNYGDTSLTVIADLRKTNFSSIGDIDSSAPGGIDPTPGIGRLLAVLFVVALGAGGLVLLARRRPRRR